MSLDDLVCVECVANATVMFSQGNLIDNVMSTASSLAFSQCLVQSLIRWASIASYATDVEIV